MLPPSNLKGSPAHIRGLRTVGWGMTGMLLLVSICAVLSVPLTRQLATVGAVVAAWLIGVTLFAIGASLVNLLARRTGNYTGVNGWHYTPVYDELRASPDSHIGQVHLTASEREIFATLTQ